MTPRPRARGQLTAQERTFLDALLAGFAPRLAAYVRRVYGNSQETEDIVAETFCRAAANVAALRASGRPEFYLLTVARNLCRDGYRRPQPHTLHAESQPAPARGAADPAAAAATGEERESLLQAVATLPEDLREVVVLRLSGELRFEDIAELLGIPLGTALSRMHAAVERLRERMGCVHEH